MLDATWSRPILMAERKIRRADDCGFRPRISHTADTCVIVMSFSTPSPAITMVAETTDLMSRPGAVDSSIQSSSDPTPVRCDHPVVNTPASAANAMPNIAPKSAAVVRIESPWAR